MGKMMKMFKCTMKPPLLSSSSSALSLVMNNKNGCEWSCLEPRFASPTLATLSVVAGKQTAYGGGKRTAAQCTPTYKSSIMIAACGNQPTTLQPPTNHHHFGAKTFPPMLLLCLWRSFHSKHHHNQTTLLTHHNHSPSFRLFSSYSDICSDSSNNTNQSNCSNKQSHKHLQQPETMEQFITKKIEENEEENSKNGSMSLLDRPSFFLCNETSKKRTLKIIVEGNIGSGKTTFLSIFSKICSTKLQHALVLPEPVDLWRNVGGVNIFQLLADDPKRWSFTFQSYVQLTMLKLHSLMPDNGTNIKVMERSIYSARYCFIENLLRKNLLDQCEYHVLNEWFKNCIELAPVDFIIYLRTNPDIVYERIHRRARPEESKITLDYLRSLHELHEDWLLNEKFPLPAPVITIDANVPLEQIVPIYEEKTGPILRQYQVAFA